MKQLVTHSRWLLGAVLISLATLGVLFAPVTQASDAVESGAGQLSPRGFSPDQRPDLRIFNEDFLVADGQILNDNVAVLNGNVTVHAGGIINGDLSVVRGHVDIAGQVRGNLAVVQGDAALAPSARIEGDVSIVGGQVTRADGAYIGGNFVGGPSQDWRGFLNNGEGTAGDVASQFSVQQANNSWMAGLFWRLVQAILWTLLITGLVVLIVWLAPVQVKQVAQTAEAEPALTFAVGLVVSVVVAFLSMGLFATLCLAPAGFLLTSLLAIAGLLGWAATALWFGERLAGLSTEGAMASIPQLVFVAVSALFLTGLTFISWALVACIGFVVGLLFISPGVGAVLVNMARRTGRMAPSPSAPAAQTDSNKSTSAIVSGSDLGLASDERAALQTGAGMTISEPSDFTRLKGIGPAFDRRLKDAGIQTFAALAALTAEEVSAIIGWTPERVMHEELVEQAAALAQNES